MVLPKTSTTTTTTTMNVHTLSRAQRKMTRRRKEGPTILLCLRLRRDIFLLIWKLLLNWTMFRVRGVLPVVQTPVVPPIMSDSLVILLAARASHHNSTAQTVLSPAVPPIKSDSLVILLAARASHRNSTAQAVLQRGRVVATLWVVFCPVKLAIACCFLMTHLTPHVEPVVCQVIVLLMKSISRTMVITMMILAVTVHVESVVAAVLVESVVGSTLT
mmetsp:Transcript_13453/g.32797  ORF Transcript_13453/g.32797 Transcript_13453/m.32797 type:complete len:217 (+) Transcript_13453:1671-2321(+)